MNKTAIRKKLLSRRKSLDSDYKAKAETAINQRILTLIKYHKAHTVAAYIAIAGEVSLQILIDQLQKQSIKLALPCIDLPQLGDMTFALWNNHQSLNKACLGLSQPQVNQTNTIHANEIDLVIVPLLGFNSQNYRIGWGKGYYDKYFAFKKEYKNRSPLLIGAAFSCQHDEDIPVKKWDVQLDTIVTER